MNVHDRASHITAVTRSRIWYLAVPAPPTRCAFHHQPLHCPSTAHVCVPVYVNKITAYYSILQRLVRFKFGSQRVLVTVIVVVFDMCQEYMD
jgi:hypothetical protein